MRHYVADLPGGTATTTVQIQTSGTIRRFTVSYLSAAVGKIEISRAPTSQIGTAQPTREIIARLNASATAGNVTAVIETSEPVKAFDSIYVHQTGTGNLGSVNFDC